MQKIRDLDLNLCTTFLTVAKLGSVSKAANELHVSQPAVSYSIKTLEERLNCKLFSRTAKGVELTADAVKLMYYIESAYNTLETGFKILNDSNDLLQGEVRIGVPTHICIFLVSDIIELFNKNYPGIKFSIVNKSTAEMVDMLEKRNLDLIIDSYPIDSSRKDITIVDLLNIDNCFVASNKYSNLLNNNKPISIEELTRYPLILQPKKTSTRRALEAIGIDLENKFEPNIEVATTEVMLELVKKGLGIGYFARQSVLNQIQSGELIEIPIQEELPKTKIGVVYIEEFLTNAPKKFVEVIKEKANILNSLKEKTIRLILLQDCIYNCSFCHKEGIQSKKEDLLNSEDIRYLYRVLNKNYSIRKVHLTGGEPLLKKNLKEIVQNLKREGANVKITTNGYLLKSNMWLGELVDKLNISLHSINKEKYEKISTVKNSYNNVINAIKEFRFKYPILKICINMVLIKNMNDSIEDIEELIKFASSIKADLKIIESYPNVAKVNKERIVSKVKQMGYNKKSETLRKSMYSNENHNIYFQKCTCAAVAEVEDKTQTCKQNNDIFITQDGAVNLCRNSEETIELCDIIKKRADDELVKAIKEVYEKTGNDCKC